MHYAPRIKQTLWHLLSKALLKFTRYYLLTFPWNWTGSKLVRVLLPVTGCTCMFMCFVDSNGRLVFRCTDVLSLAFLAVLSQGHLNRRQWYSINRFLRLVHCSLHHLSLFFGVWNYLFYLLLRRYII